MHVNCKERIIYNEGWLNICIGIKVLAIEIAREDGININTVEATIDCFGSIDHNWTPTILKLKKWPLKFYAQNYMALLHAPYYL